jgi:hypothetical protein
MDVFSNKTLTNSIQTNTRQKMISSFNLNRIKHHFQHILKDKFDENCDFEIDPNTRDFNVKVNKYQCEKINKDKEKDEKLVFKFKDIHLCCGHLDSDEDAQHSDSASEQLDKEE